MKAQELVEKIESTIKEILPNSFVHVRFSSNLIQAIDIRFAYKPKSEWTNGYIENDPAYHILHVYGSKNKKNNGADPDDLLIGNTDDSDVNENIQLVLNVGGRIYLKNYSEKVKIPFRKQSGPIDNIINKIDNYFTRLRDELVRAEKAGSI